MARVTRNVGPLSVRAEVASVDPEKRTVDLVWTTGARVRRGFWEPYEEELSLDEKHVRMGRLNSGRAPLLDSHNGYDLRGVLGVVESARIDAKAKQGHATVRFARPDDSDKSDRVFRLVQDGIIRNVSVGYRVHRLEKVEETSDRIPVMRATDWEPYEISMVPMGADAEAAVRAEGAEVNPCEFVTDEPEDRMPEKNETTTATENPQRAPAPQVDEAAIRAEAAKAERERAAELQRVGRGLGLPEALAAEHVAKGTSVEEFRKIAIDERAKGQTETFGQGPRIDAGEDARDKFVRGMSAWLVVRSGLETTMLEAAKRAPTPRVRTQILGSVREAEGFDPGEFRGLSMVDMARQSLERAGIRTAGWEKMKIIGEALVQRAGYHSTGDFSTGLENVMHKTLLASYLITPDSWSRFCKRGSVADFRAHPRYRLGTFGTLSTVNEGGEFPNLALADPKKESVTAATKGGMVGISRQALINDDMGMFNDIGMMVGRSAKLTIEKDVYAVLALNAGLGPTMGDTVVMFDAAHSNIGGGAAISMAAIDADRVVMGKQKDPSNNEILELRPAVLLVPLELEATARAINEAPWDPDTTGKLQKPNIVKGLFRDVVGTARLSGTRRYMFAEPAQAPAIEVAFLEGQELPYLEVRDGWRVDGVEWKVREDYGIAAIDFRGAVTNAGA